MHPSYVRAHTELISALERSAFRFRALQHLVFLCGAADTTRRDLVKEYLGSRHSSRMQVFYAESVWTQIAGYSGLSALEMEALLGRLSDAVIIIVESPGAIAELGAFSLSDELRPKLLVVMDRRYQGDLSFIATGPVAWASRDSKFAPEVYADFDRVLLSMDEIELRLEALPEPRPAKIEDLASSPKHLMFFLSDLVAIIEPADISMLRTIVEKVVGDCPADLSTLIELAAAMGYVNSLEAYGRRFYFRAVGWDVLRPVTSRSYINMPELKARFTYTLRRIPAARALQDKLADMRRGSANAASVVG